MDTLWTVVITQPQSIVVGKHFTVTIIKLLNVISQIHIIHLLPFVQTHHGMLGRQHVPKDVCHRWHCRVSIARPWRMGADRLPLCRNSFLSLYNRRSRHQNLWDGQCVSSWWPLVGLGYLWWFVRVFIYNCVFGSLISDITCNHVSDDGRRDGLWWPALLGHWLSYTGSLLVMYWLMFGMLFLFLTTSLGCFCPQTLLFK